MNLTRRQLMLGAGALVLAGHRVPAVFADSSPAVAALDRSALIYLTPVVSGGAESACKAEVWFVHHEGAIYVVTQADAWRAEALRRGFNRARIWIGEFGPWKSAGNRYRSAPYLEITGGVESDSAVHGAMLPLFGKKYASEWGTWGPRFRDGLASGKRVMLRYVPG